MTFTFFLSFSHLIWVGRAATLAWPEVNISLFQPTKGRVGVKWACQFISGCIVDQLLNDNGIWTGNSRSRLFDGHLLGNHRFDDFRTFENLRAQNLRAQNLRAQNLRAQNLREKNFAHSYCAQWACENQVLETFPFISSVLEIESDTSFVNF